MSSGRSARGERRGADRRHGRSHTCGLRTEAELLQGFCVHLARWIQTVGLLKFFHSIDGRGVPLAVRFAAEGAVLRESGLNFGDTLGRGGFLPGYPAADFFCGFSVVRFCAGLCRRRLCPGSALGLYCGRAYTHTSCNEQRQGQLSRFSHSHRFRLLRRRRRKRLPEITVAGLPPERHPTRTRSESGRCPGGAIL
jgi:hypothetical protein